MPVSQRSDYGAVFSIDSTVDLASVAANTSADQTVTVNGVFGTDDILAAIPPAAFNAGLSVSHARVTADNTISLRLANGTAAPIDATSGLIRFVVGRH